MKRPKSGTNIKDGNPMRHQFIKEEEKETTRARRYSRGGTLVRDSSRMGGRPRRTRRTMGGVTAAPNTDSMDDFLRDRPQLQPEYVENIKRKFRLFKEDDTSGDIWNNILIGFMMILMGALCLILVGLLSYAAYDGLGIWGITIPIGLPFVLYTSYWIGRKWFN